MPSHASLKLRGILLPFTTPFKQNEEFDAEGLRANLRHWNSTGIAGYVALGSTGERVNVSENEYLQIIECARDEVPQNLSFIVGAGQESRRGSINEVKRAAEAGADAVLVITPHFYRAAITQTALVNHYLAIADASPVPLLLYSMPDLTGVRIEPETAAELSVHPNIIGIKDSSADVAKLRDTQRLSPADFAVLTGNGTVLYEALRAGAWGGILAVGCVATFCCLEIFRLVRAENNDQALALQEKLTPLALAVTKRYGIGGLKASLNMLGLAGGAARLPLESPGAGAEDEIASLLDAVHDAIHLKA
ncbi:MAG TPA: dihydrodipicolinate synthase family protein [Pyrinomonadaceae bacterium]|nr:dihydrodipicolinate synthase family protein [Pyrinomonadaceae bacterium]